MSRWKLFAAWIVIVTLELCCTNSLSAPNAGIFHGEKQFFKFFQSSIADKDFYGENTEITVELLDETSVEFVSTKNQQWKVAVSMVVTFHNPDLSWSSTGFNVSSKYKEDYMDISHELGTFWSPPFMTQNQLAKIEKSSVYTKIYKNGSVHQEIQFNGIFPCPMDLKTFPFDTQHCYLELSPPKHLSGLTLRWNKIKSSEILTHVFGNFILQSLATFSSKEGHHHIGPSPNSPTLGIKGVFERQYREYISRGYLPVFIAIILAWLSVWLTPESLSRALLLITALLTILIAGYQHSPNSILYEPHVPYTTAYRYWVQCSTIYIFAGLIQFAIVSCLATRIRHFQGRRKNFENIPNGLVKRVTRSLGKLLNVVELEKDHVMAEQVDDLLYSRVFDRLFLWAYTLGMFLHWGHCFLVARGVI